MLKGIKRIKKLRMATEKSCLYVNKRIQMLKNLEMPKNAKGTKKLENGINKYT